MKKHISISDSIFSPSESQKGESVFHIARNQFGLNPTLVSQLHLHNAHHMKKCRHHFFHVFFRSGYYFGIFPFAPFFSKDDKHYRLEKGHVIQRVGNLNLSTEKMHFGTFKKAFYVFR